MGLVDLCVATGRYRVSVPGRDVTPASQAVLKPWKLRLDPDNLQTNGLPGPEAAWW